MHFISFFIFYESISYVTFRYLASLLYILDWCAASLCSKQPANYMGVNILELSVAEPVCPGSVWEAIYIN